MKKDYLDKHPARADNPRYIVTHAQSKAVWRSFSKRGHYRVWKCAPIAKPHQWDYYARYTVHIHTACSLAYDLRNL